VVYVSAEARHELGDWVFYSVDEGRVQEAHEQATEKLMEVGV
jgi:hypothetical protein